MSGEEKIWKMKPIAMKVMPTPASAESSAARGVCRRIHAPKNEVDDLHHAAEKSRDERDFPGQIGVVRLAIDRPEDEKDEREKADRVHAEGQRRDRLARSLREPVRLPRVEEISRHERDRDAGQDAADHERIGQSRQLRAEPHDDDELAEIVDEESEKAVDIVRDKPSLRGMIFGRLVAAAGIK